MKVLANILYFALGYIAQWLERLTADQQVPGSNPGVPSPFVFCACNAISVRRHCPLVHGQRDRVVKVMD